MPKKTVYQASIEYVSILDENAEFDESLGKGLIADEVVVDSYERMAVCRHLDEVAFKLQRSGRMGTYPQNKGQEAAAVGTALSLRPGRDWVVPCYRENAALFMMGLPMHYILLYWMGDERGSQIPENVKMTPLSVPIGTHMLHAAGIGYAEKIRKTDNVVATYFGDGATSEGDFHEAMNFASVLQTPTIFVNQNNSWAISVPRSKQMHSETVAQKALAYGMPTIRCDGNDIFAVKYCMDEAVKRARSGGGPSFIECVTYRLGDHTTADDARRYRDPKEVEAWLARDPLIRTRKYLEARKLWDDDKETTLKERAKKIVKEVVATAEGIDKPDVASIFDAMYANIPEEVRLQRDTMRTSSLGKYPEQVGLKGTTQRV
ncbi:MAG TPA: pyruvate dehydrogenase (acetyl-transferring) E1 component subunit alpha [Phycisphaerales bacterium]|nr:pyruvate dehydrogenase (acetyl-transferring) E1 component subunit alpha [Phycisphaerales bacterium]